MSTLRPKISPRMQTDYVAKRAGLIIDIEKVNQRRNELDQEIQSKTYIGVIQILRNQKHAKF